MELGGKPVTFAHILFLYYHDMFKPLRKTKLSAG
jgi:hypothetical protein